MSSAVGSKTKRHCGHCDQSLSKTVYFHHKRLYYDKSKKEWSLKQIFNRSTTVAFRPTGGPNAASFSMAMATSTDTTAPLLPEQHTSLNAESDVVMDQHDIETVSMPNCDNEGELACSYF